MLLYTHPAAEINTFRLGNFLDGRTQVEPGMKSTWPACPASFMPQRRADRGNCLSSGFLPGSAGARNGLFNSVVAVQGVVSFVVIHLPQVACFCSSVGQEHSLHFVGYFQIGVHFINIGI